MNPSLKKTGVLSLCAGLALLLGACSTRKVQHLPTASGTAHEYPIIKREFRGAWLPTIFRSEYSSLSRKEARDLLSRRIQILKKTGCNVVLFQVRAESDAWYQSNHEPWSKYLTGKQGKAPEEAWDPLAFMVEECHKNGMELHAWINPFRGASNAKAPLAETHPARLHPEWFVRYGNSLVLDPGIPQGRRYISSVVGDIVQRYDVDAIHLDDYFYPYPISGEEFPDEESFSQYGLPVGYRPETKDMWRRNNVNLMIADLSQTIRRLKPWVRLGIGPFGIYRNAQSDPKRGSRTAGLQCYDNLYADVLHWAEEDWIDYVAPQIYWNIGYEVADYEELVDWWSRQLKNKRVQLYVGQDVKRTMDSGQLELKMLLSRAKTQGNIFWPADELIRNYKDVSEELSEHYQKYRAMLPEWRGVLGKSAQPAPPAMLWEDRNEDGHMLMWEDKTSQTNPEAPRFYAIYAFAPGDKVSIKNPKALVLITREAQYTLPQIDGQTEYTFVVTAVNRFWQESKPKKIKVRI